MYIEAHLYVKRMLFIKLQFELDICRYNRIFEEWTLHNDEASQAYVRPFHVSMSHTHTHWLCACAWWWYTILMRKQFDHVKISSVSYWKDIKPREDAKTALLNLTSIEIAIAEINGAYPNLRTAQQRDACSTNRLLQ